ncbi:unnamed protein product [Paramecium octaurelia]|uniref:Uncharacterized protein n=1 Tax=Paramecium octaurelia TaxID=43137 RepID=A0A8S1YPC3_PAROT|nr:unnamed protein product [Paramecium octaurelia]
METGNLPMLWNLEQVFLWIMNFKQPGYDLKNSLKPRTSSRSTYRPFYDKIQFIILYASLSIFL